MYKRIAKDKLFQLSAQYPIATIAGPRQSGKTTHASDDPTEAQIEKDVKEIKVIKNLKQFERFIKLCTAHVG